MDRKPQKSGIFDALKKLESVVPPTPLVEIEINGTRIWCKNESAQPVGAFKLRGAWHRLTDLTPGQRRAGVVAFSSGNHAQGVAWAAARLQIAATIVMPTDAPAVKIAGTKALGAEVILYDRMRESREEIAQSLARERGAVLVPSFDDPWVIEGQGTAGLEAEAQFAALGIEAPDLVVTPCGGGGLAAGLALALPAAQMVVAEPVGWDDMGESLRRGMIVPVGLNPPPTLCDAIQTLRVCDQTFSILRNCGALGVSVSEAEVVDAMRLAWTQLRLRIEPGGAAALAAIASGRVEPTARTLVMLSGGNVDAHLFDQLMADA